MTEFSRASSLLLFDVFCQKNGLNYQSMLSEAGLPTDILEQPENLISFKRLALLLEICAERSCNPLFGLQYGTHQGIDCFGPLLYLLKNANTVGESLNELVQYFHLHSSGAQLSLEKQGDLVVLGYNPISLDNVSTRQACELAMGVGRVLLRTLLGRHWQPHGVYFQTSPTTPSVAYKRSLGVAPQFNSTTNAWVFSAHLLDLPLSEADPVLHSLMQKHVSDMDQLSVQELPSYVTHLLRSFLPNGRVTLELIADYMMLSPRSLQRYLAEQNTSFHELLEDTRRSLATRYLKESQMSLTELAGVLGYSDLAAFSRAFNRWFGMSPRKWRKDLDLMPARALVRRRTMYKWVGGLAESARVF
ncbi:MAG: AraC family transcriptional regulator [Marinobacter sp.]